MNNNFQEQNSLKEKFKRYLNQLSYLLDKKELKQNQLDAVKEKLDQIKNTISQEDFEQFSYMYNYIQEKFNINKQDKDTEFTGDTLLELNDMPLISPEYRQSDIERLINTIKSPSVPFPHESNEVLKDKLEELEERLVENNKNLEILKSSSPENEKQLLDINDQIMFLQDDNINIEEEIIELRNRILSSENNLTGGAPKDDLKSNLIPYPNQDDTDFNLILNKYEFTSNNAESKRKYLYQEPVQLLLRNYISQSSIYDSVLLYHGLGVGKCHKRDTPILMYDGTIKPVQDIQVGDFLMGDDSTPRQVLSLARGHDMMYDVIPVKGDKYTVNSEHILCLKASGFPLLSEHKNNHAFNIQWIENNKFFSKTFTYNNNNRTELQNQAKQFLETIKTNYPEQILEIAIKDYLKLSEKKKSILKGYRTGVNFDEKELPIDPYMLGYWLGDGTKRDTSITSMESTVLHYFSNNLQHYNLYLTKRQSKYTYGICGMNSKPNSNCFLNTLKNFGLNNTKHIPHIYKCNSRENRLQILAGIIDADGYYSRGMFEISQSISNETLIDDIIFLARSLGFACYKSIKQTTWTYKNIKKHSEAFRIIISGNGLDEIPTLVPRKKADKRRQIKDVLVTGISVIPNGRDEYFGFTLDKNCRYLLSDFTVTHNTCSSITIAEGFKEYITNMGKKVMVLIKNKNIQKNFINELASLCTGDEYLTEEQRKIYTGTGEEANKAAFQEKRREIVNNFNKTINKTYQFLTYGTFVNRVLGAKEYEKDEFGRNTNRLKRVNGVVQRKITGSEIRNLNNTVIIVDEAHNITNNDMYTALLKVLQNSYNYRLVLLTATPMYDNPKEMFELSNLLNANSEKLQLPIRNALFKDDELVRREQSDVINSNILKGGIIHITENGLDKLETALRGKVSYMKPDTSKNPQRIDKGVELIPGRTGTINVVYCQMSKEQYITYLSALKSDIGEFGNFDFSSAIQNIESVENTAETTTVSKTGSLYKNSTDASTMTYPNGLFGKDGFLSVFRKEKSGKYILKKEYTQVLTTELKNYSSKLYKLLRNVNNSPGNVFVFSNYVSFGGTTLLRHLFAANGFVEFRGPSENGNYKSFVIFDESTNIETRERYRRIFNSIENRDGKLIKILIGSPIISEGITLKNVRQVHLLEPSWNMSRINQIIGRAIRYNSHAALPEKDRTVEVYKYASVFYTKRDMELLGEKADEEKITKYFIDREKYILSEEKDRSNKIVERLLKENAFDCHLMKSRNQMTRQEKQNADGKAACDYQKCEYTCKLKPDEIATVDKSTYNMHISDFDKFDIFYILKTIRELFRRYFIWSLDDIISSIISEENVISHEAIYTTLNYVIQNKITFTDMYERDGFIINRGPYYIFNNIDIDVNASIYSKILDFSVDTTKYTLGEYVKRNFDTDIFELKQVKKPIEKIQPISPEDRDYNEKIIATAVIFGTYRQRGTITDPYGPKDDKFRIVDLRKQPSTSAVAQEDDRRKNISGMWIGSYKKPKLLDIAKYLKIETKVDLEEYDKEQLGKLIEKHLQTNDLILK